MALLLEIRRQCGQRGNTLTLRSPSKRTLRAMEFVGVDTLFTIEEAETTRSV